MPTCFSRFSSSLSSSYITLPTSPRHLLVMPNCIEFNQHSMHRVTYLLQQLFVRVIVHVANNLPLLQHVLVKVVTGLYL